MSLMLLFSLGGGGIVPDIAPSVTPGRVYVPTVYARAETDAEKYARRVSQGIIVPEKPGDPIIIAKVRKGAETPLPALPNMSDVKSRLAELETRHADIASKQITAKADKALARYQTKQALIAAHIAAARQLEAAIMIRTEETDVAFVAALLMEI